jgi:hypothetical protein
MLYDDCSTKICTSTWPQVGRAVAKLLSHPVQTTSNETSLEQFRSRHVYISSFTISQKDMLDSILRVTGDERSNWKITQTTSREQYEKGAEAMRIGDWRGAGNFLYDRVFFPDDEGNFEKSRGLRNDVLGLPKEDLDEFTQRGIARAKEGTWKRFG